MPMPERGLPLASPKAASDALRNAKIVIADDDALCRKLVGGILRARGIGNLHFADGGVAAIEKVRSLRADLLLLDMEMPDIGGLEVCERLRADPEFADLPILALTATVDRKKMGGLFAGGASDFLSKPVNPSELVARVVVHLERLSMIRALRDYQERISRELDAARRMQFELLPPPSSLDELADVARLRIGAYNRPSSELGGDIWGILPIDASSFGIFLADFTGHGVNAAMNTFRLHALIHDYKDLHDAPAQLLAMLNLKLTKLLPRGQFATFLYVIIDHVAGRLRFASAGAPPMIIVSGIGEPPRLCGISGLPLGIEAGAKYRVHARDFPMDSMLLLFSDGLSEYADASGRRLGEAGLARVLSGCHPGLTPHETIDRLCTVAGIGPHDVLPDDTTVVCIDRRVGSKGLSCRDCLTHLDDSRHEPPARCGAGRC